MDHFAYKNHNDVKIEKENLIYNSNHSIWLYPIGINIFSTGYFVCINYVYAYLITVNSGLVICNNILDDSIDCKDNDWFQI